MTEKEIQNRIRLELSKTGIVLRNNVGVFQTEDGRYISSGLPKGMPDLGYWGENGVAALIEVKAPNGRLSKEQRRFIDLLSNWGHRIGVARSVEEALMIVNGR